MMESTVMSKDYRLILGKISMDMVFAEKFFSATASVLEEYNLTADEKIKLKGLSAEKFEVYRNAIALRTGDCDSCCNGGQPDGYCSECSASCCA